MWVHVGVPVSLVLQRHPPRLEVRVLPGLEPLGSWSHRRGHGEDHTAPQGGQRESGQRWPSQGEHRGTVSRQDGLRCADSAA